MARHNAISKGRWLVAQKAEIDYWQKKHAMNRELEQIRKSYLPVIKCYAAALPGDISILDLGCGPTCPSQFIEKGRKIFSDPLLDQFRRLFPGTLPHGEYDTCMAEDVDQPDASCDLILCINALSHMQNPELVLNEVDRLLKQHGIFILSVITHPQLIARIRYVCEWHFPVFRDDRRPYAYTISGMKRTVQRHFDIIEQVKVSKNSLFPALTSNWLFVCRHKS